MTSEEELKKLNRLIHQFETVYRTTRDGAQKERVAKQLKELRSSRQAILDENFFDVNELQQAEALGDFKHLRRLLEAERHRPTGERLEPLTAQGTESTSTQDEVFHLMLYARFFKSEFLPFLAERRLKLDYKFSLERAGFYTKFNDLERKLDDFREESARLLTGAVGPAIELEMRKRNDRFKHQIKLEAAKFFRDLQRFCHELVQDADADGVKCLNGAEEIAFEGIEGAHLLEGRTVRDALVVLSGLASEVMGYLKVPLNDS